MRSSAFIQCNIRRFWEKFTLNRIYTRVLWKVLTLNSKIFEGEVNIRGYCKKFYFLTKINEGAVKNSLLTGNIRTCCEKFSQPKIYEGAVKSSSFIHLIYEGAQKCSHYKQKIYQGAVKKSLNRKYTRVL